MRIGVDEENPWDSFNTLTIKKKDIEDCWKESYFVKSSYSM
jgi:hypothetical protein